MKLKGPNGKIDETRKVPDGIERKGRGVRLAIRQLVPSSGKTTRRGFSFACEQNGLLSACAFMN